MCINIDILYGTGWKWIEMLAEWFEKSFEWLVGARNGELTLEISLLAWNGEMIFECVSWLMM